LGLRLREEGARFLVVGLLGMTGEADLGMTEREKEMR
jgi:hypothetical protein